MIQKIKNKRLAKTLACCGVLLLGLAGAAASAVQFDAVSKLSPSQADSDRLIIKYRASKFEAKQLSTQQMQRLSASAGMELRQVRQLATGAHLLKLGDKVSEGYMDSIIAQLASDPNIEYIEKDTRFFPLFTPNDAFYNEQWHYYENTGGLNVDAAWDITNGAGAVVAVIDTGYRPHVDLNDNLLPGYDMISSVTVAQDGNGRDSNALDPGDWEPANACFPGSPPSNSSWHGTHVAGTVAAETNNGIGVAGVAFGAKVVPIRALGRCGGFLSDIADSVIWGAGGSVSGVPANANPADVLNLSLGGGGPCSFTMQSAINTARSLGATVVAAAGNSNANVSNATPANCNGVVAVAATDRQGNRAFYSNFGSLVDVAAPGGETSPSGPNGVLSTLNSGTQGPGADNYVYYQGTSMATPHVAGVAALMYSVNPNITPSTVESLLKSTARAFPGSCSQCGSGIVDAAAAVAAAAPAPSSIGEAGKVSASQANGTTWQTVNLSRSYNNPVVIMQVSSTNGGQPSTVRLRNVSGNSFQWQLDEWDYLDGGHTTETFSYLVVEAGVHNLGGGRVLQAGNVSTNQNWASVSFPQSFSGTPVVMSVSQTFAGSQAMVTRQRSVNSAGFQVRVQEEEANDDSHATENIGWIAMSTGNGSFNFREFEARRTGDSVTHTNFSVNFTQRFSGAPVFLVNMQSTDGADPAGMRVRSLSASGATFFVEEEQSFDTEINHTTETAGFIAIEAGRL